MSRTIDTDTFLATGHATTVPDTLVEPVQGSGYYQGHNGFWYWIGWHNGRTTYGPIGYSAAYVVAEREYLRQHGAVLNAVERDKQLQFIAQRLELI